MALLSNVFYITLMPETKGMSMLEIRNMFRSTLVVRMETELVQASLRIHPVGLINVETNK